MARPETIADVTDRTVEIGEVRVTEFATKPAALRAWAAFIEAISAEGGRVRPGNQSRDYVNISMPRDNSSLREQLANEQYAWDQLAQVYEICCIANTPPEDWQRDELRDWCHREGKPLLWLNTELREVLYKTTI